MRIFHRQLVALAVLTTATVVFLNGTRLGVRDSRFGMGDGYLGNTNYFADPSNPYLGLLFGQKKSWDSMGSFLALTNDYDMRRNQGLMNSYGQASYNAQFGALAESAVLSWQNQQIGFAGKFFAQEADQALGVQALRRKKSPVMIAGLFLAMYAGRTLRYHMTEDVSLESRTKMDSSSHLNSQYVGWKSNTLEASLGATYSTQSQTPGLNLQKKLTRDVSVNYETGNQQAVGVSYSRGF